MTVEVLNMRQTVGLRHACRHAKALAVVSTDFDASYPCPVARLISCAASLSHQTVTRVGLVSAQRKGSPLAEIEDTAALRCS